MAVLPNTAYTLADWFAATDEKGDLTDLVNLLSQENEILTDLPWIECNNIMSHKTTVLTGLPAAYWRQYNAGVQPTKATRTPIEDTCGMLETYSSVDKDLSNLNGNSALWRLSEDKVFLDGMNQQMASTLFYGNQEQVPAAFNGLATRFSTVNTANAANAVNVIDAGGTASTNTSVWLCNWGQNTGLGIFPKGSKAGLQMEDVSTPAPVTDANGGLYQALRTKFKWDCGLTIRDWRYFVRIANIDVTLLSGGSAANLIALMIAAINKLPAQPRTAGAVQGAGPMQAGLPIMAMRPAFYVNRTVRTALHLQALNKTNVLLQMEQFAGQPVLTFLGIPVRTADALLNTEARVT